MPLQDNKSQNTWVKISKVYINSDDREDGDVYSYRIKLNEEIQYVIGMELTSYSFPTTITPSFTESNRWIDMSLTDGTDTSVISISMPIKPFTYNGYQDTLDSLMTDAIDADPIFGSSGYGCYVIVNSNGEDKTEIEFYDDSFDAVTMTLAFQSGPNASNSAYEQMGFEQSDYSVFAGNTLTSPNPVNLTTYNYFDVNIEEARELRPLSRIYRNNNSFSGIAVNELNVTRTRVLSSEPIRSLRYLTVRIRLAGGVIPPTTEQPPHDIGITVLSVGNENSSIPRYLTQTFIL